MQTSMELQHVSNGDREASAAESTVHSRVESPAEAAGPKHRALSTVACSVWGLVITAGFLYGWWYEITPAETDVVPSRWPAQSACVLSADRPTLLMFVHPHCPCTRASLSELAVLMARCEGRVDAQVLFFQPRMTSEAWAKTDLWRSAAHIPGVEPRVDSAGAEQRRFHARVSGEVFLFLPSGALLFHGGITAGRGHAGDNLGRSALEAILLKRGSPTNTTPVFGCALELPTASRQNAEPSSKQSQNHER